MKPEASLQKLTPAAILSTRDAWSAMVKTLAVSAVFLSTALAGSPARAASLVLVENGQARAVVVTAEQPSPTAAYAAEELVWHIKRATGVELAIVPESAVTSTPAVRVYVGQSQAGAQAGIDPRQLPLDAALVRAVGNNLFIVGRENNQDPLSSTNNHAGVLFGVYELIEQVLQVRWLWPGELGTYVPPTATVAVPADIDRVYELALVHRHVWGTPRLDNYRSAAERDAYNHDFRIFNRRHRLGETQSAPSPVHSFSGWWGRYSAEHPEWFAMNDDGERVAIGMCVANPDFHRYIIEEHAEHSAPEHGSAGRVWSGGGEWIRLGDVDSPWLPCRCPDCRAWDGPLPEDLSFGQPLYDRFGHFGVSDRYARFYQTIYEKAVQRNPDVKVAGYLYWTYFPAPTTDLQISPQVYGHFCAWGSGWGSANFVYFPISNAALEWKKAQWRGWRDTGMSLIYRPNHWNGGYVMPHITWQGGEFFQWAYQNGMVGFKFDKYTDHWAVKGPMLYMYLRLFAHPDQEISRILAEYYEAFGPAADHVRRYFDYWEAYSRQRQRRGYAGGGPLYLPGNTAMAFPEEIFTPAEAILAEARDAAQAHARPEYADRVHFLWLGLEHARLTARFWESMDYVSHRRADIPEEPRARLAAVEAFAELEDFRRRHGNSNIVNFDEALTRREARCLDIETLRQLRANLNVDE